MLPGQVVSSSSKVADLPRIHLHFTLRIPRLLLQMRLLDPDPLPSEVGTGVIKEGGRTHSPLIGKDLHIGRSGYSRPPPRAGTHSRLRGVWSGDCPPSILCPPPSGMRASFLVPRCRSSPGRSFS